MPDTLMITLSDGDRIFSDKFVTNGVTVTLDTCKVDAGAIESVVWVGEAQEGDCDCAYCKG